MSEKFKTDMQNFNFIKIDAPEPSEMTFLLFKEIKNLIPVTNIIGFIKCDTGSVI